MAADLVCVTGLLGNLQNSTLTLNATLIVRDEDFPLPKS